MPSSVSATLKSSACRVAFGGSAACASREDPPALRVALERLAGDDHETLLAATGAATMRDDVWLFPGRDLSGGFGLARPDLNLEAATTDLYRRLFAATEGLHLYRLWNYVPHINACEDGLENYRRFCRARSLAFEASFGKHFQQLLPSSSAVGASAGPLAVAFVAGPAAARHFENPAQVPAFNYPPEHGPRPPSFSRATVAATAGATQVFISGTAAIHGHATVAPGELATQLECTLNNLRLIGEAAGVGASLGAGGSWQRRFKVYLRHPDDLRKVVARLERGFLGANDQAVFLRADICRAELVVEIEASLVHRNSLPTGE
jgi:enamine deaminase RidA (YjgF/YER057c/UK114 family)